MNYIIKLSDGRVFGGWNPIDGHIVLLSSDRISLAYRMQKPIADRTLSKVRDFAKTSCYVERLSA